MNAWSETEQRAWSGYSQLGSIQQSTDNIEEDILALLADRPLNRADILFLLSLTDNHRIKVSSILTKLRKQGTLCYNKGRWRIAQ